CMLPPGPEAQQLATYVGWLMHRTAGGLIAGLLFIAPGALVMLGLSMAYALFGQTPLAAGIFFGVKAAVLAVVAEAILRIGRRALKSRSMLALAVAAFIAIWAFQVPFPLIVLGAGLAGWALDRHLPEGAHGTEPTDDPGGLIDAMFARGELEHTRPRPGRWIRVLGLWSGLWLAPLALLVLILGSDSVWTRIAAFFSTMGVVTFGGAYAVLSYVAQAAVSGFGWLSPGEMADGLARRRPPAPAAGRRVRRPADHLGDLRAVLPVDLPGRPLCGATARQPRSARGAQRHHRRCGRGDRQPCPVVRAAHPVPPELACQALRRRTGPAGAGLGQPARHRLGGGGHGRHIAVQGRHGADPHRLRHRGRRDQRAFDLTRRAKRHHRASAAKAAPAMTRATSTASVMAYPSPKAIKEIKRLAPSSNVRS
ncbi:MAG TPA: chromate transporter, partial [Phenylobacterium sp.]|nr:chromate transporter [Phenylobacterium sp.]